MSSTDPAKGKGDGEGKLAGTKGTKASAGTGTGTGTGSCEGADSSAVEDAGATADPPQSPHPARIPQSAQIPQSAETPRPPQTPKAATGPENPSTHTSAISAEPVISAKIAGSIGAIGAERWNALRGADNPFMCFEFLSCLEDSASIGAGTGWQAAPIILEDDAGELLGALPSFLKGHSQGEFVFDHAWADAYQRAGGQYYPKLQIAAPFTPATGPRLLLSEDQYGAPLLGAAAQLCRNNGFSSAHATFITDQQLALFQEAGWLLRSDIQFHWHNDHFADFEGFLATLSSRKRKAIRKERRIASEGLEIIRLSSGGKFLAGQARADGLQIDGPIEEKHWDAFWQFYQDTGARKWGTPYLTREAFSLMGQRMGDKLVLILAMEKGEAIAGALNFLGPDALYGRYWGCNQERRFLHFELCYYQAIEMAIALQLGRVEAGAQGGHKLARGYAPVQTHSAHWIDNPGFRDAVARFLEQERESVNQDRHYLAERTPFKPKG